MSTVDVAKVIVDYLGTEVGELFPGENLFKGPLRPVPAPAPNSAVFVLATGGPEPLAFVGDGFEEFTTNVQIRIRYQGYYSEGDALSRCIRDAIQRFPVSADVFDVRLSNSAPLYLGLDDDSSSYEWVVNLTVTEFATP